jgi:CBS domain-containing protein
MAERYPIHDYHRRYEDEERYDPNRERDKSYQSEWSYRRAQYHLDDVRAADVMTRGVVTVYPWETVEHAARLMGGCDCGVLPVVNNNRRLIGMVTDRDIALRIVGRGMDPRHTRVGECMSEDLHTCHDYDSIESCMRLMARHQIRRLPIVDDHDRLVGIISQGDLAWFAGMHPGQGNRRAVADLVSVISEPARAT